MVKKASFSLLFGFLVSFILVGGFTCMFAEDISSMECEVLKKHLLSTEGLMTETITFSNERLDDIAKIAAFLDNASVEKQLSAWGFNAKQIKIAVKSLTNSELEYLARQSEKMRKNFFAGADTGRIAGLVALGALALFIVMYNFDWLGVKTRMMEG
jgi:hypothetical protein